MLIGIDAHNLEGNRTGVGRYLFNLLKIWSSDSFNYFFNTLKYQRNISLKFTLYFKDEIPQDLPKSKLFEFKLLKVGSTAKFVHWDLCWAAKRDKVDILFCPGYVAPIFYRGRIALTLHDIIYEAHPEWFEWKNPIDKILLKWVSKISAKKAKLIFTISEFSRQEIIKYYQTPPSKVTLTYLGVDPYFLLPEGEISLEGIKAEYQIEDKFIFYVGSIFNRRHLPEVILAFLKIAKENSEFQMFLSGKDHTSPFQDVGGLIRKANERLGRQAILRVDFVNENDLKLLYSACAFFIWLSDYEGFGLPPLEAMANGAPVITSDSTSLKEVAGNAALLIKDNSDVEEIYQAMKRIIKDEGLRQELIKKGKEQAAKFSWEKCAEKTLRALLRA